MACSQSRSVPGVSALGVTEAVAKIQDSRAPNGSLETMKEGKCDGVGTGWILNQNPRNFREG